MVGTPDATSSTPSSTTGPKTLIAPIVLAVVLTTIFGFNYLSSGHEPIATELPFRVVGSSTLPHEAQGPLFSLDVKQYASQADATQAMDKGGSTERSSQATRRGPLTS